MNASVTAFFAPLLVPHRYASNVLRAWQRITRDQLACAMVLAVAASAPVLFIGLTSPGTPSPFQTLTMVIGRFITAFCILLTVAVADDASDRGSSRLSTYATALVTGVLVGTLLSWLVSNHVFGVFDQASGALAEKLRINASARYTIAINAILEWLLLGSLAIYVYADRRETLKMRARLHAAELERSRASRRLLESELQAMQARVEPEFLFDTLAHVRRLYITDARDAEELLDHLIAYLRAAMPQTRDTSSSLGQETDLVRSYLAIISVKTGGKLAYTIDDEPELAEMRLPAMMLQPLVDYALAYHPESTHIASRLRISSEIRNDRLRVVVSSDQCHQPAASDGQAVGDVRERLAALYAANASLALTQRDLRGCQAVMEIPLARANDRRG